MKALHCFSAQSSGIEILALTFIALEIGAPGDTLDNLDEETPGVAILAGVK